MEITKQCIAFAQWIKEKKWISYLMDSWVIIDGNGNYIDVVKTTAELYGEFLKDQIRKNGTSI